MSLPDDRPSHHDPQRGIHKLVKLLEHLLYRRTILLLAILFCVSVVAALWNMSSLSINLIKSQALQNSVLYAQAIQEARSLYSADVVDVLQSLPGTQVTHAPQGQAGKILLPVTFLINLSNRLEAQNPGMAVRLYSDYPFPWHKDGGAKDSFEQDALNYLRANPQGQFIRVEPFRGNLALRYAQADLMTASCIGCHNTHPNSPKKDWKIGDVRGVLTISTPLDGFMKKVDTGLRGTSITLGLLALCSFVGIVLVMGRLRRTSYELEQRVRDRTADLQDANTQLSLEQEKSERLLLNILPESIAKQLKEGRSSIANGFSEATVLFADIVNFTQLSERISPLKLVSLLNHIFSEFDRLTEKHGLEKIKTIGDAYMVVGGLPIPRTDHAEAIADMALDMQRVIHQLAQQLNYPLNIRIGINSGPVVAGVIGTKKFIYDLWGDTVNTASRMESHGMAGSIQVTQTTYERLKANYTLELRGNISIKGKGEMNTYWLVDRQSNTSALASTSH